MKITPFILLSGFIFTPLELSFSQKPQEEPRCRCCEIGRFYAPWLKDLPKPKMRQSLGNAELKITTNSKKAQAYFNQGLNCLHGFWEVEAYRYFLAAAEADPDCAMAYWGICMSLPGKLNEAINERTAAHNKALELSKDLPEHEKLYINTLTELLNSGSKSACKNLKIITEKFPNDLNAIGYLAYWSQNGYTSDGQPKSGTKNSIEILEKALAKNPEHVGIIHYYIHIMEPGADFLKAQPYLERLTSQGKDISHLLHMPGHIHYLTGDYQKASHAFLECYNTEISYFANEKLTPNDLPNYSHNLHYWAKNEAELGNYDEAIRIAKLLRNSALDETRSNTTISQARYDSAPLEAYINMRFQKYTAASKSLDHTLYGKDTSLHHYIKFLKHYCDLKAEMNATADWNKVYELTEAMEETMRKFQQTKDKVKTAGREDKRAAAIMHIYNEAAKIWLFNVDTEADMDLSLADILLQKEAQMFHAEPPMLVAPVAEELGWLCISHGKHKKALTYFQLALKKRAKSGHIYSGMIHAYKQLGNNQKVTEYQQMLDSAWQK